MQARFPRPEPRDILGRRLISSLRRAPGSSLHFHRKKRNAQTIAARSSRRKKLTNARRARQRAFPATGRPAGNVRAVQCSLVRRHGSRERQPKELVGLSQAQLHSFIDRRWASRSGASEGACSGATAAGKVRTTASTFAHCIQSAFSWNHGHCVPRMYSGAFCHGRGHHGGGVSQQLSAGWRLGVALRPCVHACSSTPEHPLTMLSLRFYT